MRIKPIELPHLAIRAPAHVAVPGVPQIDIGESLKAARRVEPRGHLMGKAFILYETMVAGRSNCLLVEPHGVRVSPFDAGDLGRHPRVLVAEGRWTVFGPLAQLLPVRRQELAPPVLLVGSTVLVKRRYRQRCV